MKSQSTYSRPVSAVCVANCAVLVGVSVGCVSISPRPDLNTTTEAGRELLNAALEAHGAEAFSRIADIAVSYDGEWRSAVWVFQPALTDRDYRKRSEERILLPDLAVGQRHFGPVGEKHVFRQPGEVDVWYDDVPNTDQLKDQAAAAVADGYLMFLLGPFYFQLREAVIDIDRPTTVAGRRCDQLIAVLRPGFGSSPEDRVLVAIDAEDRVVRRLRFTFNALPTTQGVVADVLPSNYIRVDGVLWPTQFVEVIKNPLVNLTVHRWEVTGLDTNRGITEEQLRGPIFDAQAAAPAGSGFR